MLQNSPCCRLQNSIMFLDHHIRGELADMGSQAGAAPKGAAKSKMGKSKTGAQAQLSERRRDIAAKYSARHPEKAAAERALRKNQHLIAKRWDHKRHGTPETHEHASRQLQGSLHMLYIRGVIDQFELADAEVIAGIVAKIGAELTIRTVSLETRVDASPRAGGAFYEALGWVRAEMAYGRWRAALPQAQPVLAMIVGDLGISAAAARHNISARRARRLLLEALAMWPEFYADAVKRVDAGDLVAMHAGLL